MRAEGDRSGTPRTGAVAGSMGAAVALAATAVVHALAPRVPFAPVAVAETLVRATPGGIATFFIELLGHLALPLAVVGVAAGFAASSALAGRLFPRFTELLGGSRLAAAAVLGVPFYALAILSMRPDSQTVSRAAYAAFLLPAFGLSAWVAARTFGALTRPREVEGPRIDATRRLALRALWVGGAGLALGWTGLVGTVFRRPDPGQRALRVRELTPATPPGAGPDDPGFRSILGLAPEVTPNDDFYVVDEEIIDPDVDPDIWTLSVSGLVDRTYTLTYDELLDLPALEQFVTLECISNDVGGDLISTARWTGIRLADLLSRAGVRNGAVEVVSTAVGGYSDSITISQAMLPTTLVAIGMNGRALPRAHGFPARLLVPGLYGMKQPKWLESIEVVERPYSGYWEKRGWSKAAVVRTMSRIDTLAPEKERLIAAGVAFGGDRGISRVEVSTDGGATWGEAELRRPLSGLSWRQWRFPLGSPEGTVAVAVRATDGEGALQEQTVTAPHPSGATGYDMVTGGTGAA